MPNSILWIGLVVLWVFVLFPILADRHPRIRQTTDAALATRVLHRGGSKRRTKSGPAAGHDSDPDWRPTRVQRKRFHSDDAEDRMTKPADEPVTETDEEPAVRGEIEAGPTAPVRSAASGSDLTDAEIADLDSEFDEVAAEFDDEGSDREIGTAEDEFDEDDRDIEFGDTETTTARTAAKGRGAVDDDVVAEEIVDRHIHGERSGPRIPPVTTAVPARILDTDDELEFDADDPDFVPTRRGRGGYDPEADAIARAARYTFRQRAVLGLVLAAVGFGGSGVAVSPLFWWGCALSAVVLVTYLAYLRKQVRMEEEIRRRRAARLVRGRGERTDEELYSEKRSEQRVMDRDTARALRRRSALLEADDEDPMFDHLEIFDAATARALRRGAGDMRRAAGA